MSSTHPSFEAYEPSSQDPFDRVKAAHLLNRAGFGGTEAEVQKVIGLGPKGAVDWLLDFSNASADEQNSADVPDLSPIKGPAGNFRELRKQLQTQTPEQRKQLMKQFQMANREAFMATFAWWMKRMAGGSHPLQEKLTLFWHGHFTTSFREERAALLIWEQNELLRKMAGGNFRKMLHAVSRDPAMLDYLNNNQNRKGHPNENFAREVMELFTLGIGNYSENDIKEGARAFTGWMHDGDQFVFNRRQHDEGMKRFLGKSGNFNGDDVLNIILEKPDCAKFISSELFAWFVRPDPEPAQVDAMAKQLRDGDYELRPVIKTLLTSKAFYSAESIGVQIKSPVQLVAGTIHLLGIEMPPPQAIFNGLQLMGQVPLMPPNVKGWPGGHNWINASTLFARYNSGVRLAQSKLDIAGLSEVNAAPAAVDALVDRLIQRPVEDKKRKELIEGYESKTKTDQSIRAVVQLIVSMPEYQLC
ncbi:MAG TPA: DUF1800 domain-containing protein [Tepidisphaeraceae bacterium]|jgi:uncharacterized protein (DUF1800 family)